MHETFAQFTRSEWYEAARRLMSDRAARAYVEQLFRPNDADHGNFISFDAKTWAALSLVSDSCRARVASMTADFPEAFRAAIDAAASRYQSSR